MFETSFSQLFNFSFAFCSLSVDFISPSLSLSIPYYSLFHSSFSLSSFLFLFFSLPHFTSPLVLPHPHLAFFFILVPSPYLPCWFPYRFSHLSSPSHLISSCVFFSDTCPIYLLLFLSFSPLPLPLPLPLPPTQFFLCPYSLVFFPFSFFPFFRSPLFDLPSFPHSLTLPFTFPFPFIAPEMRAWVPYG